MVRTRFGCGIGCGVLYVTRSFESSLGYIVVAKRSFFCFVSWVNLRYEFRGTMGRLSGVRRRLRSVAPRHSKYLCGKCLFEPYGVLMVFSLASKCIHFQLSTLCYLARFIRQVKWMVRTRSQLKKSVYYAGVARSNRAWAVKGRLVWFFFGGEQKLIRVPV
jgi:hypothetical protein